MNRTEPKQTKRNVQIDGQTNGQMHQTNQRTTKNMSRQTHQHYTLHRTALHCNRIKNYREYLYLFLKWTTS